MSVTLPFAPPSSQRGLSTIGIVLRDFRLGGSERVAIGLANYWSSCGLAVVLVVARDQGPLKSHVHPSVGIIDCGMSPHMGDKMLAWALAWQARKCFARYAIDACYVPGNSHWPVLPALATLGRSRRPVTLAQISSPVCREGRTRLGQMRYDWRMRALLRHADRVTTLSEPLADETMAIIGSKMVDVVPLPALWDEEEGLVPVPDETMTILAAGRLTAIKGFDGLIRAFRLVRDRHAGAKLVICGEGEERPRLEALIEELDLTEAVTLTGYVPSIRPYLQRARVFTLTSHLESFGAVLLEALAAGRQIVATRCSPAVENLIVSPLAGRSVPTRDVPALADALSDILDEAPPPCEALAQLVKPFHVSHGGRLFLSLMQAGRDRDAGFRDGMRAVF